MLIHSQIVDGFLDDFDAIRKGVESIEFKDIVSPVDGVTYPHIFADIPKPRLQEIESKLTSLVGRPIAIKYAFIRLSPEGVCPPHLAHSDAEMGDYSVMIYISDPKHCRGGTALVQHAESGLETTPKTQQELELLHRDCNNPSKWRITHYCPMRPNRAFIFDSDLLHWAEPHSGYGKDAKDGRLVLTVFFTVDGS